MAQKKQKKVETVGGVFYGKRFGTPVKKQRKTSKSPTSSLTY